MSAPNDNAIKLLVCSANLGNAAPDDLSEWIPADGCCGLVQESKYPVKMSHHDDVPDSSNSRDVLGDEDVLDIIVVGLQESTYDPPSQKGESVQIPIPAVQKTVKKTQQTVRKLNSLHSFALADSVGGGNALRQKFVSWLPSYELLVNFSRGEMRLMIFVHTSLVSHTTVSHVAAQNTGRGGLPNKGGILGELMVKKTRMSFISAHLQAHEGDKNYATRCQSTVDILNGTKNGLHDASLSSHYTFVLGDLNFRTDLVDTTERDEEERKDAVRQLVAKQDWKALNEADELQKALRVKDCLVGFRTPFCNFPPTFKLERISGYHYVDQRLPSYTDRILWKTADELEDGVVPLSYESIDGFSSSDHKPIRGIFLVKPNEPFSLRPRVLRHRSMKNMTPKSLLRRKKKTLREDHSSAGEAMHLFISDLSCTLMNKQSGSRPKFLPNEPPRRKALNPYLLLVSDPEIAIRKPFRKFDRWTSKAMFWRTTKNGWRRSSVKKATSSPEWTDEEIHAEVKTHHHDGSAIDLAGSMLRLTVMNFNPAGDDEILGTYTANLVALVKSCLRVGEPNASSTLSPVQGLPVDAPLLLNGMEVGRIRCSIETWWMNKAIARISGSAHAETGVGTLDVDSRDFLTLRDDDRYYHRHHHLSPRERKIPSSMKRQRWRRKLARMSSPN